MLSPSYVSLFCMQTSWNPYGNIIWCCSWGNWEERVEWFAKDQRDYPSYLHLLQRKSTAAAAAAKSLQSCPTLCDPIDGSPPGSPVPRILQARTLEWVAISSPMQESEKWKWSRSVMSDSSRPHGLQPTRLLHPWDSPGKSTGVGCQCLLRRKSTPTLIFT